MNRRLKWAVISSIISLFVLGIWLTNRPLLDQIPEKNIEHSSATKTETQSEAALIQHQAFDHLRLIGTLLRSHPEKSVAWIEDTHQKQMLKVLQGNAIQAGTLTIVESQRVAIEHDGVLYWLNKSNSTNTKEEAVITVSAQSTVADSSGPMSISSYRKRNDATPNERNRDAIRIMKRERIQELSKRYTGPNPSTKRFVNQHEVVDDEWQSPEIEPDERR